jgi:hypothetical protein
VPAIAGGIGALWAVSDGGIDSRDDGFEIEGEVEADGAGLPGPANRFGLGWPG